MPKTALELSPNEWKRYSPWVHMDRRVLDLQEDMHSSRENALQTAKQAANILREHFGAYKVVVFGSLATDIGFTKFSDIDLAAWGISGDLYYKAVAAVTGLSANYKIDLIDPDFCRDSIKQAILEQGVEL